VTIPLSRRQSLLKPTAVNAILSEMGALQAHGRDIISLMRGEPDFTTPGHIVEAAVEALRNGRTRYPDNRGEPRLREAIAAKIRRDNGLTYDPGSEILVTTGATLGIHAALMALVDEGDDVLVPDPVYDAYASPILLAGGRVRSVPATRDAGRFVLTAAAVEASLTPVSRVLLLNTPWNPVGTVFRESELRAIAAIAARRGLTIISDEIYETITYDGARHISPALAAAAAGARSVLVNSLSKTYAMTGWRVGYCAAPASVIAAMLLVLQQSSRGPATFVQDAACAALTGSQQCVEEMRLEYERRRAQVLQALDGVPRVHGLAPEGGFFAMVDLRETGMASDDVRRRLLREHEVAVVHGAAYGPGGEGTLRVSFGSGGELLTRGLDRLRAGLLNLGMGGDGGAVNTEARGHGDARRLSR
jgi:aspartate aminotransferase